MAKLSKRMKALKDSVDRTKLYPLSDALALAKKNANAKFDESIDVAVNLGIDARKSDQLVRGSVVPRQQKMLAQISWVSMTWLPISRPVKWISTW